MCRGQRTMLTIPVNVTKIKWGGFTLATSVFGIGAGRKQQPSMDAFPAEKRLPRRLTLMSARTIISSQGRGESGTANKRAKVEGVLTVQRSKGVGVGGGVAQAQFLGVSWVGGASGSGSRASDAGPLLLCSPGLAADGDGLILVWRRTGRTPGRTQQHQRGDSAVGTNSKGQKRCSEDQRAGKEDWPDPTGWN